MKETIGVACVLYRGYGICDIILWLLSVSDQNIGWGMKKGLLDCDVIKNSL